MTYTIMNKRLVIALGGNAALQGKTGTIIHK